MARESSLSSYSDSQRIELIGQFNSANEDEREILAEKHGYASSKSLRNSMASQWGRNIFTNSRNTTQQVKEKPLEIVKAQSVPVKFSSLWSSMSSFVDGMPKSIFTENGEIDKESCTWLQDAIESDKKNPFVVSIEAWNRTDLESIFLLLSVESRDMKEARIAKEESEKEADRKRVEVLESRGYTVIGGNESKVARMIDYHTNLAKEIDCEVKRLNGNPDVNVVKEVMRRIEVSGKGHTHMKASFEKLEQSYNAAIGILQAEVEKLKEYNKTYLKTDEQLQTAIVRIGKLLPKESKQRPLTEVQQKAVAAMVEAGMSDVQARAALGV